MTGLETAIILIAFVTIAAVFGYAVLSAGLFSAERGKETIYSGLNEARSNLELSGSVMARSDDNTNVRSILFTVKNAIAGNPIDMTPCNGTSNASNKCVISLSTGSDYINNVKWTKFAIGANDGNDLLETGEQFEITVDLADLGAAGSLSENLTANDKFSLQVKPALGSTITIQRTLPASIGPVMDLDLMFGSGGSGSGGVGVLALSSPSIMITTDTDNLTVQQIAFNVTNTGSGTIDITPPPDNTIVVNLTSDNGDISNAGWSIFFSDYQLAPGESTPFTVFVWDSGWRDYLQANTTFTITITPQGGSALIITKTLPGTIYDGMVLP